MAKKETPILAGLRKMGGEAGMPINRKEGKDSQVTKDRVRDA